MRFIVTIIIPAYGVKETRLDYFADAAAAQESVLDDVAFYWMAKNGGNDLDVARKQCDVEFQIDIKSIYQ